MIGVGFTDAHKKNVSYESIGPPLLRRAHDGLHERSPLQLTRQRLALQKNGAYQLCRS
jgi:hypothetical protein